MKFVFDRDAMIKVISIVQEIIINKSPISIYSSILLIAENNGLTIKATDTSVKYITTIPVDIHEEGRTTIYCDKFIRILSSLPSGDIEFTQNNNQAIINPIAKKVKFTLNLMTSDKFPEIGSSENIPFFEIASKDFKEMIKNTIFAVSDDKNRYFMTGVLLENHDDVLTMAATDGKRLSRVQKSAVNIPSFQDAIIPVKILSLVLKHAPEEGNIQIAVIDKSIFVKFGAMEFSSALFDGQFPNYRTVIPASLSKSIQVNKADLDAALKRTTIMVDSKVSRIIFKISSGVLKLVTPSSDIGAADEEIPCRYEGQDITMALNYNYVTDPLKVIDSEDVVFEFNCDSQNGDELSITKAVVLRSEPAGDYIHVIMPMNY